MLGARVRESRVYIHESCKDLIAQMDNYTDKSNEHDDLVDAASMLFAIMDAPFLRTSHEDEIDSFGYTFFDLFNEERRWRWREQFAS